MRAFLAQTRIETTLTLRRGESLLVSMIIPAGVLVFFSYVPVFESRDALPVDYLLPGVLAIAVAASAMVALGIATGFERHYGVLKRLGATPLSRPRLLLAKASSTLVVELIQVTLLVVIGLGLGSRARIDPGGLSLAILAGTLCFAGIGLLLAGAVRAEVNLALSNAAFLVFLLMSGAVVRVSSLPASLEAIARVLPAARLTDMFRWALGAGSFPYAAFGVVAVWTAA